MSFAPAFHALSDWPAFALAAGAVLALQLAVIAVIDARTQRIPDPLNALLAVTGFGVHWFAAEDVVTPLAGAACGYVALALVAALYRRWRHQDGLGLGDAKFLGGAGAWLGWAPLPFVILFASACGLAYVSLRRLRGATIEGGDALAFGPFLSAGVLVVWLALIFSS